MSLSSDIARGNTERLAGRIGSANLPARLSPRELAYCSNNTDRFIKPRREMRHHLPALEENNPSPSHIEGLVARCRSTSTVPPDAVSGLFKTRRVFCNAA